MGVGHHTCEGADRIVLQAAQQLDLYLHEAQLSPYSTPRGLLTLSLNPFPAVQALVKAYWEDWKTFHLYQIVNYYRQMKSFPVVHHCHIS